VETSSGTSGYCPTDACFSSRHSTSSFTVSVHVRVSYKGPQWPSEPHQSSQFNRIHRQGWWPGRSDRNHLQKCKYHMCSEFRVIEPLTDQAIANASCAGYQKHGQTPCSHLDTLSSRLPDGIVSLTRLEKVTLSKSLTSALYQYKLEAGHL
jgi:hypothetical protein